jgi:hypothetical protein
VPSKNITAPRGGGRQAKNIEEFGKNAREMLCNRFLGVLCRRTPLGKQNITGGNGASEIALLDRKLGQTPAGYAWRDIAC